MPTHIKIIIKCTTKSYIQIMSILLTNIILYMVQVRRLSYRELQVFRKRWQKAVEEDDCWVDPFQ